MSIENFVPGKGEKVLSARVPNDLWDFVEELSMLHACDRTEATNIILKYARGCDDTYRWITVARKSFGKVDLRDIQLAMDQLGSLSNPAGDKRRNSKRMEKEKRQLKSRIENRIAPAMIDAGRDAGKIVTAFQPTTNGQPDKIANRTTAEGGFRVGGDNKKLPTSDEAAERAAFSTTAHAGGAPTTTLASSDGKINTAPTREQHDKNTKRRAKKRGDETVMSGTGWA
jgi:hypothetical protein